MLISNFLMNYRYNKSMRVKSQIKRNPILKIHVESSGSVTDFQYNHNGEQLAVSDSDGNVFIYQRNQDSFVKTASFKGDDAAIWKISWADPTFGETLAIGSFKRKVSVFQSKNGHWHQIAYHQLHEGSANHIQWASPSFGCKLFSAASDGSVAILQLKKNNWVSSSFFAHQCSITSLSVRPIPLNQVGQERTGGYPLIATAAKDNSVRIWKHTSQIPEEQLQANARIFQQIQVLKIHKESIRAVLWRQRWTQSSDYELFTCSQDGTVKLTSFVNDKVQKTVAICEFQFPVFRLAQSMTGNLLTVAIGNEEEASYLYEESQKRGIWDFVEQLQ